jgi:hypothetical protein
LKGRSFGLLTSEVGCAQETFLSSSRFSCNSKFEDKKIKEKNEITSVKDVPSLSSSDRQHIVLIKNSDLSESKCPDKRNSMSFCCPLMDRLNRILLAGAESQAIRPE